MSESVAKRLVDVYPYLVTSYNKVRYLLLKRSSQKVYSKQWRMVGGKLKQEETYWQGAYRELVEEIGLYPELFWSVPSINQFYEYQTDTIHRIPAFAAKIDNNDEESIVLNQEHDDFVWCTLDEAERKVLWPEQRRLIRLVERIVTNNELLDSWIIPANTLSSLNI